MVNCQRLCVDLLYRYYILSYYRPISLTNYDYKIIAFILAARLQNVIGKIVNIDQTGYIKGRYIGCSARMIQDIFEYCENYNTPGAIICLDFQKAFDSLDWNFMFSVLEKYNFGQNFIKWIKILYNKPTFVLKNNGWMSEEQQMNRGVRQGCPISALLFILAAEMLGNNIRNDTKVDGLYFNGNEHKLSQYADDTSIIVRNKCSVKYALDNVQEFCDVSGTKLNLNKCEGIWLGSLKDSEVKLYEIPFTKDPVKCLGIYIGHNSKACFEKNWENNITKFENTLNSWKQRKLTLFGKVLIIKNLALSKLTYRFSLLSVPEIVIKRVKKLCFSFIWNKRESVKRNVLYNDITQGGINMIDIDSHIYAIKAAWVSRLIKTPSFFDILSDCIKKEIGLNLQQLLKTNFKSTNTCSVFKNVNLFYNEVFISFNKCKSVKSFDKMNSYDYLTQIIWCNDLFKIKDKCICFKNWIDSGFIYIKDLFTVNGTWISGEEVKQRLNISNNWMVEYLQVKKALGKSLKKFDTHKGQYINIKDRCALYHGNQLSTIENKKTMFFYDILRAKLFVKPYIEVYWEKIIERNVNPCHSYCWPNIYKRKVLDIKYNNLVEFNFKVLHNILPCGKLVSKWDTNTSMYCLYCQEVESIQHLLFECRRVLNIWDIISTALNVNIKLKQVIIGYHGDSRIGYVRNVIITIIAHSIFRQWILCKQNVPNKFNYTNLLKACLDCLRYYATIFKQTENIETCKMYDNLLSKLEVT